MAIFKCPAGHITNVTLNAVEDSVTANIDCSVCGHDARRATTLEQLLATDLVFISDGNYIGRAADGVEVNLGTVGFEDAVEEYLKANPTLVRRTKMAE